MQSPPRLILLTTDDSVDAFVERLDKSFPPLRELLDQYIQDMKTTVQFATASGVTRPIKVNPLMLHSRTPYYADGVCFEVVRKNKYSDVLASGGRYGIFSLSPDLRLTFAQV